MQITNNLLTPIFVSPGINDPFTAMAFIDSLSTGLAIMVKRNFPIAKIGIFHFNPKVVYTLLNQKILA